MKRMILCLSLLLGMSGISSADQNDSRLNELFVRLVQSPDPQTATTIEADIWNTWLANDRTDINELMQRGTEAMNKRQLDDALAIFNQMVELAPDFAEGWNKRATVYYLRDELNESVKDVQRTLALEPRHFGAHSGMGLIFMQVGDDGAAIKAFEEVLKLNPQSISAKFHIEQLRKRLRDELI